MTNLYVPRYGVILDTNLSDADIAAVKTYIETEWGWDNIPTHFIWDSRQFDVRRTANGIEVECKG